MKKSKKLRMRIISIFGITAMIALLSLILIINIVFPTKYRDLILSTSQKYEVDTSLVCAVVWTESKYNKNATSKKGASGLMQLLPSTAEYMAKDAGIDNFTPEMLFEENINIVLGVRYLKYLFDRFGDETKVLAAYNAGEGNVLEWQEKGITKIPFKETREYIKRVRFAKKIYNFKGK